MRKENKNKQTDFENKKSIDEAKNMFRELLQKRRREEENEDKNEMKIQKNTPSTSRTKNNQLHGALSYFEDIIHSTSRIENYENKMFNFIYMRTILLPEYDYGKLDSVCSGVTYKTTNQTMDFTLSKSGYFRVVNLLNPKFEFQKSGDTIKMDLGEVINALKDGDKKIYIDELHIEE